MNTGDNHWILHENYLNLTPAYGRLIIRQEGAIQISLHCVRQLYKVMQPVKFLCLSIRSWLPLLGTNDIHHCNIVQPQAKCNMLCLFNPRSFQKVDTIPLTKWTSRSPCCSTRLRDFDWRCFYSRWYGRDICCMCLNLIVVVCNMDKFWMQNL